MSTFLYPVIESPGASSIEYLAQATNNFAESSLALVPSSQGRIDSFENVQTWQFADDGAFSLPAIDPGKIEECFLFFATQHCLASQIEALLGLLQSNQSLSLGRILSFVSAEFLHCHMVDQSAWFDGAAHFSDVFCFLERSNENASAIKSLMDRYQTLRYPLEFYQLSKKSNPWSRILAPSPRRVSHVFDSTELLEEDDTPENDPFLLRLPNGKRVRPIPIPFWD